jgi:hypothetical protein
MIVYKNNRRKDFTSIPRPVYPVLGEGVTSPFLKKGGLSQMPDGGSRKLREQPIDTEPAEPPSPRILAR